MNALKFESILATVAVLSIFLTGSKIGGAEDSCTGRVRREKKAT